MRVADTGLPIEAVIPDVQQALMQTRRGVLVAEPGAGKTTVVPLRFLDQEWLGGRKILVLEPRRLAARAAAQRMATLLGEELGDRVGVITRDFRRVGPNTRIEVVTEGILTRRIQNDPGLEGIGLVVFDEFHERNLEGELGLALTLDATRALQLDLGILVMSATLEGERVATLIGEQSPAPLIHCEGRTFPIDITWRPRKKGQWLEPAAADAVRWALVAEDHGDVLVFLPGIGEIRRTASELGSIEGVDVHLLHGSLPMDDQDAAVRPGRPGRRKVVLSTDIAETSLTVVGVRIIVDGGLARSPQFDPRTGMTRLVTQATSRASAEQRAGRAGRTEPGIAVRLWSKIEHGTRPAWTAAAMTTVDLAGLLLETSAWGTADPQHLAFLDPPPKRAVREGQELLAMLGAVQDDGRLSAMGKEMNRLPLHPRLARMVVAGRDAGHGWLACLLASLLDERDVLRGRPNELPSDLALRLDLLLDEGRRHPQAAGRSLQAARHRARDLARRLGESPGQVDRDAAGSVLVHAYPDRIGQRRGSTRGKFRLRNGSGAWVPETDALAGEQLIVAADLDGKRTDARIRMGAAVDQRDVIAAFGEQVVEEDRTSWHKGRNDLTRRVSARLDSLDLGSVEMRPEPGPDTEAALLERVRATRLKVLDWTPRANSLRERVMFVRGVLGDGWPDMSDGALLEDLETWLAPFMPGARGRADLQMVSLLVALENRLTHQQRQDLRRLAPKEFTLPGGGKAVKIDYSGAAPTISIRAQKLYGCTATPMLVDGRVPITFELLSPADRPIQKTADLAGFWTGSWAEVRKDMAGRYPKHHWPKNPGTGS